MTTAVYRNPMVSKLECRSACLGYWQEPPNSVTQEPFLEIRELNAVTAKRAQALRLAI